MQNAGSSHLAGWGVAVLVLTGVLLCLAWRSLIVSFGQLNRGKFRVINEMEKHFPAAIYAGEWEALDRGENPKTYRSFTSREIWVPNSLIMLHLVGAIVAICFALGVDSYIRDVSAGQKHSESDNPGFQFSAIKSNLEIIPSGSSSSSTRAGVH